MLTNSNGAHNLCSIEWLTKLPRSLCIAIREPTYARFVRERRRRRRRKKESWFSYIYICIYLGLHDVIIPADRGVTLILKRCKSKSAVFACAIMGHAMEPDVRLLELIPLRDIIPTVDSFTTLNFSYRNS